MDKIFTKLWILAKPYYQKSRTFDLKHIQWMMPVAEKVAKEEGIDLEVFMPLVILHDIGYCKYKEKSFWEKDTRKAHMIEGAKLAEEILTKVGYPNLKRKRILEYIMIHDEWALGNNYIYKSDKLLSILMI